MNACHQHHALDSISKRDAIHPWLRAVRAGRPVCYTEDVGRHNARRQGSRLDSIDTERRSADKIPLYHHRDGTSAKMGSIRADGEFDPGFEQLGLHGLRVSTGTAGWPITLVGRDRGQTRHRAIRDRSASSKIRTSLSSRRNPSGTSARQDREDMIDTRRACSRRPGAAEGGGDKRCAPSAAAHILSA